MKVIRVEHRVPIRDVIEVPQYEQMVLLRIKREIAELITKEINIRQSEEPGGNIHYRTAVFFATGQEMRMIYHRLNEMLIIPETDTDTIRLQILQLRNSIFGEIDTDHIGEMDHGPENSKRP